MFPKPAETYEELGYKDVRRGSFDPSLITASGDNIRTLWLRQVGEDAAFKRVVKLSLDTLGRGADIPRYREGIIVAFLTERGFPPKTTTILRSASAHIEISGANDRFVIAGVSEHEWVCRVSRLPLLAETQIGKFIQTLAAVDGPLAGGLLQ